VLLVGVGSACKGDEISAPPEPVAGTLTIDASQGWAYVSLGEGRTVTPAQPATSPAWDIAYFATSVMLNGGAAGPGGVAGYCVCQNAGASSAQIVAMTPESELADFESVTAANIPAAPTFQLEALVPAVAGWYTGTGSGATAAADKTWLLRLSDETSFAKLRVVSLRGASAATPGDVTIEYAVQPTSSAPLGAPRTLVVNAANPVSIDLNAGAVTTSATDWDIRFDGYVLRLNSGVSGTGKAGAATTAQPFDAVTSASVDARAYRTDVLGGVFSAHPWYQYNLLGNNQIHPTFDVYLLKRGDIVYKVQLLNYYDPADPTKARRITFRYAQIAG
jgi:hypothetical protein